MGKEKTRHSVRDHWPVPELRNQQGPRDRYPALPEESSPTMVLGYSMSEHPVTARAEEREREREREERGG